jgi:hypothetical protein
MSHNTNEFLVWSEKFFGTNFRSKSSAFDRSRRQFAKARPHILRKTQLIPQQSQTTSSNRIYITMMFGHPFYDDEYTSGGDSYGFSPYGRGDRYYQQRQAAAAREARRQAELARYYRMKELEEQDRLRKRQAYERMLRQKQHEEEVYRQRRAYELERMRRALATEEDERENEAEFEKEHDPHYRLVQGPDGRIYRIPLHKNPTVVNSSPQATNAPDKENAFPSKQNIPVKIPITTKSGSSREANDDSLTTTFTTGNKKNKVFPKLKQNKTRVTVIVEDASDSESEDDEFNSVWRKRRPSPGEWMEPIEDFELKRGGNVFHESQ